MDSLQKNAGCIPIYCDFPEEQRLQAGLAYGADANRYQNPQAPRQKRPLRMIYHDLPYGK